MTLHVGKCWRCGKVLDLLHDEYDSEDEFDMGDEDIWRCRDRVGCQERADEKRAADAVLAESVFAAIDASSEWGASQ